MAMLWWTLGQLKASDPNKRVAAAEKLADVRQPQVTQALLEAAIGDSNSDVRRAAARSLQKHSDPQVVLLFIQLLGHESSDLRHRAAEMLGDLDGLAVDYLIAALEASDPYVIIGCMTALGTIGDARAVRAIAQAAEQETDLYGDIRGKIKPTAIDALRRIGGEAAIEWLIRLSPGVCDSDRSDIIRALDEIEPDWPRTDAAAAGAGHLLACQGLWRFDRLLARIGDRRAIAPLLSELADAPDPQYVISALDQIDAGWRKSGEARTLLPTLIAALASPRNKEILLKTLNEIDLGWPRTEYAGAQIPSLMAELKQSPREREVAAKVLGQIGNPAAVPALLKAMVDTTHESQYDQEAVAPARRAAIEALGEIGDRRAVEPLAHAAFEGAISLYDAEIALAKIDFDWKRPMLSRWIDAFRAGTIAYLPQHAEALPLILPMLAEPGYRARVQAALTVAKIACADAKEHLEPLLSDREFGVRYNIAHILHEIDGRPIPIEYQRKPPFCDRCGETMAPAIPDQTLIDFFGSASEAEEHAGMGGSVCVECQGLWCRACSPDGEACPACHGQTDVATVRSTRVRV